MKFNYIKKKPKKNFSKKSKNNNCTNTCEVTNIIYNSPITNNCCASVNNNIDSISCNEFENKAKHLIKQANSAKQQAIDLENEAKNLEYQTKLLYNESNEFWSQYNKFNLDADIYFAKAQLCCPDTIPTEKNNCPTNQSMSNKPLVCCKKHGSPQSEYDT